MLLSLAILPGIIQALNLADVPCGNMGSSTRRIHQRIMGGAVADIEDFPYAVSIKKYGKHHCGGSLVSHVNLLKIKGLQIILVYTWTETKQHRVSLFWFLTQVNHHIWLIYET